MGALFAAISTIASYVANSFQRYQERKQAEHEVRIAENNARKEIAIETIRAQSELSKTQLLSTGTWFKYATFAVWAGPFIISTFLPDYGAYIFENWKLMPEWYIQSVIAILFSIWGIQVTAPVVASIFNGLGKFFRERQKLAFNRKIFYDTVRSVNGNISQHEVELYEKAIKAAQGTEQRDYLRN